MPTINDLKDLPAKGRMESGHWLERLFTDFLEQHDGNLQRDWDNGTRPEKADSIYDLVTADILFKAENPSHEETDYLVRLAYDGKPFALARFQQDTGETESNDAAVFRLLDTAVADTLRQDVFESLRSGEIQATPFDADVGSLCACDPAGRFDFDTGTLTYRAHREAGRLYVDGAPKAILRDMDDGCFMLLTRRSAPEFTDANKAVAAFRYCAETELSLIKADKNEWDISVCVDMSVLILRCKEAPSGKVVSLLNHSTGLADPHGPCLGEEAEREFLDLLQSLVETHLTRETAPTP